MIVSGLLLGRAIIAHSQVTGSAALLSDYVWRGSSQTREHPAVQGSLKYSHRSGMYASLWGSNVTFEPDNGARSEFDLTLGWTGRIADDWMLDATVVRYQYPGAASELNWSEVTVGATWRRSYWVTIGYSPNAMASSTTGMYALVGARFPVDRSWSVEAVLARTFLDEHYADSYTHALASVVWSFHAPFEARVTLHDTDSAAARLFPGMAGARIALALQASL